MKLNYREFGGEGTPIVILHGLFASSKNWVSAGKALSSQGRPFALDLRNHGDSPHSESHTLEDLVEDLEEWLADQEIDRPVLLGHSMGGLAAMGFSLTHPTALRGLVVVDIAPRSYRPDFGREFAALSLPLEGMRSRSEIDQALERIVPDDDVRQFLSMNAERVDGGYRWKLNVAALKSSPFLNGPDFSRFEDSLAGTAPVPALLIAGGESEYVREEDIPLFRRYFPKGSVEVIPGCGHWLHYICSESFQGLVSRFVAGL
jgi:pimeloyl-ACP methyl ester carboxylesterase